MSLIKSISGIRGTIGGKAGEGLSPIDTVKFTAAYAAYIKKNVPQANKIVVGRDARISGLMIEGLVVNTLIACGLNVIKLGLATTPTVEIAVTEENADGGIILTASHNPKQWNALKLLNEKGEFISASGGEEILRLAESTELTFTDVDTLGKITTKLNYEDKHIEMIKNLPMVDTKAIAEANFTIVIDCVNSVGGIVLPKLLKSIGVRNVIELFCEPNGEFPHNPEPLPENLTEIANYIKKNKANVGFVVDPDVDRLAIVCEDGSMFGEEYTLVSVADYILQNKKGNTVSNLSSTRALNDVTVKHGGTYYASAVGEVNVVEMMKTQKAVIGGEGNGGIIYPELHYGRDALVGIALFLTHLAKSGKSCKDLRNTYPNYFISKNKIELTPSINVDAILETIAKKYAHEKVNTIDGVKIDFANEWVHLRKSNTEPIIRIYSESQNEASANNLAQKIINDIKSII
ncbi:MAG: phosphoglucosamine mutase [Bacteroidales bacterium]|nr:phosphoglucosamine mutase [Bacteroidales bacterium]